MRTLTLKEWLNNPYFKLSIAIASPVLYAQLKKSGLDSEGLTQKSVSSIWNYLNRMHYRATPFGIFAAFSVVGWDNSMKTMKSGSRLIMHVQQDIRKALAQSSESKAELKECFIANGSLYRVNNSFRYLRYSKEETYREQKLVIASIEQSDYLDAVLEFCRLPAGIQGMANMLADDFGYQVVESESYIKALIDQQVLQPFRRITITSKDTHHATHELLAFPKSIMFNITSDTVEKQDNYIDDYTDNSKYINLERPDISGGIPIRLKAQLEQALHALHKLIPSRRNPALQKFAKSFTSKYDRRCVSLLEVMDPEIGIGYGDINSDNRSALLKGIKWSKQEEFIYSTEWTSLHQLILKKWLSTTIGKPVKLSMSDLDPVPLQTESLPNSFSVLTTVTSGGLYIRQCGGVTATALVGRFTPLNEHLYEAAKTLAVNEEQSNPGVIFAELVHIGEMHSANIDRRRSLYEHELPIMCDTSVPTENQINLSDLFLSISGEEIYLWSKQHRKRIIPRLSSAYNYTRSNLALFRFLCDLQHQGISTDLHFDLERFFPGLGHYPRVNIEDVGLCLETWILDSKTINDIQCLDAEQRLNYIHKLGIKLSWPEYISVNEYDHQLVFSWKKNEDAMRLAGLFKPNKERLVIKEFPLPETGNYPITDRDGAPFCNEAIISVSHTQQVYCTPSIPTIRDERLLPVKRMFVPGSEWLYYKLYLHPLRANEIIKGYIDPIIGKLRKQGLLKKWFFIRYADPSYHLRVRIQLSPKHTGHALARFEAMLDELASAGIIQSYDLATYERELERYSPLLIEVCEEVFCSSATLISAWITKINSDDSCFEYYGIALPTICIILDAFGYDLVQRVVFFEELYRNMSMELQIDATELKYIQGKYREISNVWPEMELHWLAGSQQLQKIITAFNNALIKLSKSVVSSDEQTIRNLCSDIIHMHLNRLLTGNSRVQEMLLYYSFWKLYQSSMAKEKKQQKLSA